MMVKFKKEIFLMLSMVVFLSNFLVFEGLATGNLNSSNTLSLDEKFDLIELSQIASGGVVTDLIVENDIVYLLGDSGLKIINVSDPSSPNILSTYNNSTGSNDDIELKDNLLFLAGGTDGFEIIDISDPNNPKGVSQFDDGGSSHGISVVGETVFVADSEDGLEVINITDPENPIEITQYYESGSYREVVVDNDLAYITNTVIVDGYLQEAGLILLNISDLSNIYEVGVKELSYNGFFYNIYLSENFAYFSVHGNNMRIEIMEKTTNSNLINSGYISLGEEGVPNKLDVIDDLLYLTCGDGGFKIYNISNTFLPVEVAHYYDGGYAYDVKVIDNIAYVADRQDGLEIIQLYEKESPANNSTHGFEMVIVAVSVLVSSYSKEKRK